MSIVYVKEELGHHSIQVTVDTYGKWLPTGAKSLVDRLDAVAREAVVASGSQKGSSEGEEESQALEPIGGFPNHFFFKAHVLKNGDFKD